jgi:glycosyltransferase involved in cell wall biosynthesis
VTNLQSVTVAVCSRNRGSSLERAVESLLSPSATTGLDPNVRVEVLVVDNGSTDDTGDRIRRLAARDTRVRYVVEPITGISSARNRALQECRSDVLVFVDDDETVCPGFLDAHLSVYADRPRCGAVGGAMDLYFDNREPRWVSRALYGLYSSYPVEEGVLRPLDADETPPFGGNLSLRVIAAMECGRFDTSVGRVDKSLISGEETVLLEAIRQSGWELWITGAARIRHHIPAERARFRWVLRRSVAQGRTEQRIGFGSTPGIPEMVGHLLFGGFRLLAKRRSVSTPMLAEYVVHRAYWVGRLAEAAAQRRKR